MPSYLRTHFARVGTAGYAPLCVAENKLMWDLIGPRLGAATAVPEAAAGYDVMIGSEAFRQSVARLLGTELFGRAVDPGHVAVLAGAGSVLETLFYVLADAGEGVAVPTPSYAGFWPDLETRDGLHVVPVHTRADDGFQLTPAVLEAAVAQADVPVRALLLTNPDNPTGAVMSDAALRELVGCARGLGLAVVANEVYGLSVFRGDPASVGRVFPSLGQDLHVVWGFSKDFAMSGLRCGALVTENAAVLQAVDALAYWSAVSGDTQARLGAMLDDGAWVAHYLATMRGRLAAARRTTEEVLGAAGVPCAPGRAGLFLLCDLRGALEARTWEAEHALWRRFLDAGVNLTPGSACRVSEPGFFRVCFAAVPEPVLREALGRVVAVIGAR
jgi:1-aminocyclopropane-1-carboxylate synthase